jgi:predicted metal-dependent phosphoesterase TrpH
VTDHDTVDALGPVAAEAAALGLEFIPGIEISTRLGDDEIHVLGYGFDPASDVLRSFLTDQREDRVRRLREMCSRLTALGVPLDAERVIARAAASGTASIGRPHVAQALVESGHVSSVLSAFRRFIGNGCPAYVPRREVPPEEAVRVITRAGGLASLAHPGSPRRDDAVPSLVRAGLHAIEAYHSDHDDRATSRYEAMAAATGLGVTGGSDYHGDAAGRVRRLGGATLPAQHYEALLERARASGCARVPGRNAGRPGLSWA